MIVPLAISYAQGQGLCEVQWAKKKREHFKIIKDTPLFADYRDHLKKCAKRGMTERESVEGFFIKGGVK